MSSKRPSRSRPHRKRTVAAGLVLAVVAATVSAPAPATAGSDARSATAAGSAEVALPGLASGTYRLTLVTGDRVTLHGVGSGRFGVAIEPARREGGPMPSFFTDAGPDGHHIIPTDALAAVSAGRLDRKLFDVSYLARNGYADPKAGNIPVIVRYARGRDRSAVASAAAALPASEPTRELTSIRGAALNVAAAEAGAFWAAVRGKPGTGGSGARTSAILGAGVEKLWLDRRVKVTLDESVSLIGAPRAWEAGLDGTGVKVAVLDTGVDADHPDLAGRIAGTHSFVPDETVDDGAGHGTHVAGTIAGSGAASGGRYKGVAPGSQLLIGKVLNNAGSGDDSWIIDGMEWAVEQGARVVSMSLGGAPTDGTDAMSQSVNDLTASSGALFVIAGGNSGPGGETIGTPGAADAALTVAATSKSDELADFSSRGPRFFDGALKPDIAGPGVGIIAARAADSGMGTPVNEHYSSMSGTSMATPHVAGTAAILAQRYPAWTAARLKPALMSAAHDTGFTVYEQGSGRLDAGRAATQTVFATTANVDFGSVDPGQTHTAEVAYHNEGSEPVTLALTPTLRDLAGEVLTDALTADATVTVPAGGSATATVRLDAAKLQQARYTGSITAEAGSVRLHTPVGLTNEGEKVRVTIRTIGRDGKPADAAGSDVVDIDGSLGKIRDLTQGEVGEVVARVPVGRHSFAQVFEWVGDDSRLNVSFLMAPEVTVVTGDMTVTLDARRAKQVRFSTPLPAQPLNNNWYAFYQRTTAANVTYGGAWWLAPPVGGWANLWATPTPTVRTGSFRFSSQWTLGRSELAMSYRSRHARSLNVAGALHWEDADGNPSQDGHPNYVGFPEGTRDLPLVDVGLGRPEDIAGRDLRGKLVLMEADYAVGLGGAICGAQIERMAPIREAGAAGLLIFPAAHTNCPIPLRVAQIPFTGELKPVGIANAHLSAAEGLALRADAARRPVTMQVRSHPETPYSYELKTYEEGRVRDSLHYRFSARDLAQVDVAVHSRERARFADYTFSFKQSDLFAYSTGIASGASAYTGPRNRTEYIGLSREVLRVHGINRQDGLTQLSTERYDRPVKVRERWLAGPGTPGPATVSREASAVADPAYPPEQWWPGLGNLVCTGCRNGDTFWPNLYLTGGKDHRQHDNGTEQYERHLYRDGAEIPDRGVGIPSYTLAEAPSTYRMTVRNEQTQAAWTFRSARPTKHTVPAGYGCFGRLVDLDVKCGVDPLVYASYDVTDSLAPDNTVAANGRHTFRVHAFHAPSTAGTPAVAGARLWVSTDDGARWTPVPLRADRDGSFLASTHYPAYDRTKGAVSLRVEAWDRDGNRVEQTTMRAFDLRPPRG